MSRRPTGHWMITSHASGDDIDWIPTAVPVAQPAVEQFVGFSQVQNAQFINIDWATIRPIVEEVIKKKESKVDHFTDDDDLFEI